MKHTISHSSQIPGARSHNKLVLKIAREHNEILKSALRSEEIFVMIGAIAYS